MIRCRCGDRPATAIGTSERFCGLSPGFQPRAVWPATPLGMALEFGLFVESHYRMSLFGERTLVRGELGPGNPRLMP